MRVAIDNDLKRIYAKIDYSILQKTVLDRDFAASSSAVIVVNSAGFAADDFVCIGNPGKDTSEILKLASVSGQQLNFATGYSLSLAHSKRCDVYRMTYDQVKFYEDDVLLDTVTLTPDYWISKAVAVDISKYYHVTFYNSETAAETAAGEKIKGYNRLLCSIADVYQWESSDGINEKILDKIDIASREIYSMFIIQGQDVSDLNSFDVLRMACAALALQYYWMELIKTSEDTASLKMESYRELYRAKIKEATETINKQEDDVTIYGQTRCDR